MAKKQIFPVNSHLAGNCAAETSYGGTAPPTIQSHRNDDLFSFRAKARDAGSFTACILQFAEKIVSVGRVNGALSQKSPNAISDDLFGQIAIFGDITNSRTKPTLWAAIFDNEAVEMAKSIQKATSRVVVKSGRDVREFSAKGSTGAISQLMQQCPNEVLILQ
ncbi:MAG: hypothetical protein DHS20C05_20540 [Hyphococcus sp.]|nr:MAG: hypothetical protein DHS20C05_20540 [Marinicaulis sp.]